MVLHAGQRIEIPDSSMGEARVVARDAKKIKYVGIVNFMSVGDRLIWHLEPSTRPSYVPVKTLFCWFVSRSCAKATTLVCTSSWIELSQVLFFI